MYMYILCIYIYRKQSISTWFSSTDTNIEYVSQIQKTDPCCKIRQPRWQWKRWGSNGTLSSILDFQISLVPNMFEVLSQTMGSWRCLVLGGWDYSFCKCKQWLIFHCPHIRNHIESRCIIECWSRSGDCSGNLTPTSGLTAQRCAEQIVPIHWSIISETL